MSITFRMNVALVAVLILVAITIMTEGQHAFNCKPGPLGRRGVCIPRNEGRPAASRRPPARPFNRPHQIGGLPLPIALNPDKCRRVCSTIHQPVCDSNGVLYGNNCEFEARRCRNPSIKRGSC